MTILLLLRQIWQRHVIDDQSNTVIKMALFGGWFGRGKDPAVMSDRQLIRLIKTHLADSRALEPERAKQRAMARQAMLVLGGRPFSEEAFQLAAGACESGPLYHEACQALGLMGHPRAASILTDLLQRGRGDVEPLVPMLGAPHNDCAVPDLLKIALGDSAYLTIGLAVKTLTGIGTTNAQAALQTFYDQPSRRMNVIYLETPEPAYTSAFGQRPTPAELIEARREFWRARPLPWPESASRYLFEDDARAKAAVEELFAAPTTDAAIGLEWYLRRSPENLFQGFYGSIRVITGYPSVATSKAVEMILAQASATSPKRQRMLRALITAERRTQIAQSIGRALDI